MFGWQVTTLADARAVLQALPQVRPSWFFAVPRIWEKLKAGMEARIEADQDAGRKRAFSWAVGVGLERVKLENERMEMPAELAAEHQKADEMVLSKIRAQLGLDEAEIVYVGAAPTPMAVICKSLLPSCLVVISFDCLS